MIRKPVLAAAALTAVLGVGACGSSKFTANDWAKQVCGSIAKISDISRQEGALVQKAPTLPTTQTKTEFSSFFANAQSALNNVAGAIDSTKTPDVKNGASLKSDAVSGLKDAADEYGQLKQKVDSFDANNEAQFAQQMTALGDQITQASQKSQTIVDQLKASPLGNAMASNANCG